jgi:hypothetical protein
LSHLLCVGGIISLPWFSKELKNNLSKNNWLYGVIFILLIYESIFIGWGLPFPIVSVSRYKLSLCHTPIKPDLLGFPGICVFVCGLHDHMIMRFASGDILVFRLRGSTKGLVPTVSGERDVSLVLLKAWVLPVWLLLDFDNNREMSYFSYRG